MNESRHIKKESLLKALEQSLGVVTVACKKADIPRSTYYKWLNEDPKFCSNAFNRLSFFMCLLSFIFL